MGVYIYTLKNSKRKNTTINGKKEQVGIVTYLCRQGQQDVNPQFKGALTKAFSIPTEDQPKYIAFGDCSGAQVYENNFLGAWADTPDWTGLKYEDRIGEIYNIGNRNHIVPKGVNILDYVKKNHQKAYKNSLRCTQIYVKINNHYTATVRCASDLEDYINGWGADQVDLPQLGVTTVGSDVPTWFEECVREIIERKHAKS